MIIDPDYNSLYEKTHENAVYGTSGIEFLPESVLYILDAIAARRISLKEPLAILDYGCGRSSLLDALEIVLDPLFSKTNRSADFNSIRQMLDRITGNLDTIVRTKDLSGFDRSLLSGQIQTFRYDPAINEYKKLPVSNVDFLVCTDVLEHIPDRPSPAGFSVLENVVRKIGRLSPNHYLNISTRMALQLLPDGQNAHCTLKHPREWETLLKQHLIGGWGEVSPVFSRDLTSCSFTTSWPSPETRQISYEFAEKYGIIDLIPYPPQKPMDAAKMERLASLQEHKMEIQQRNLTDWVERDPHDPTAMSYNCIRTLMPPTRNDGISSPSDPRIQHG